MTDQQKYFASVLLPEAELQWKRTYKKTKGGFDVSLFKYQVQGTKKTGLTSVEFTLSNHLLSVKGEAWSKSAARKDVILAFITKTFIECLVLQVPEHLPRPKEPIPFLNFGEEKEKEKELKLELPVEVIPHHEPSPSVFNTKERLSKIPAKNTKITELVQNTGPTKLPEKSKMETAKKSEEESTPEQSKKVPLILDEEDVKKQWNERKKAVRVVHKRKNSLFIDLLIFAFCFYFFCAISLNYPVGGDVSNLFSSMSLQNSTSSPFPLSLDPITEMYSTESSYDTFKESSYIQQKSQVLSLVEQGFIREDQVEDVWAALNARTPTPTTPSSYSSSFSLENIMYIIGACFCIGSFTFFLTISFQNVESPLVIGGAVTTFILILMTLSVWIYSAFSELLGSLLFVIALAAIPLASCSIQQSFGAWNRPSGESFFTSLLTPGRDFIPSDVLIIIFSFTFSYLLESPILSVFGWTGLHKILLDFIPIAPDRVIKTHNIPLVVADIFLIALDILHRYFNGGEEDFLFFFLRWAFAGNFFAQLLLFAHIGKEELKVFKTPSRLLHYSLLISALFAIYTSWNYLIVIIFCGYHIYTLLQETRSPTFIRHNIEFGVLLISVACIIVSFRTIDPTFLVFCYGSTSVLMRAFGLLASAFFIAALKSWSSSKNADSISYYFLAECYLTLIFFDSCLILLPHPISRIGFAVLPQLTFGLLLQYLALEQYKKKKNENKSYIDELNEVLFTPTKISIFTVFFIASFFRYGLAWYVSLFVIAQLFSLASLICILSIQYAHGSVVELIRCRILLFVSLTGLVISFVLSAHSGYLTSITILLLYLMHTCIIHSFPSEKLEVGATFASLVQSYYEKESPLKKSMKLYFASLFIFGVVVAFVGFSGKYLDISVPFLYSTSFADAVPFLDTTTLPFLNGTLYEDLSTIGIYFVWLSTMILFLVKVQWERKWMFYFVLVPVQCLFFLYGVMIDSSFFGISFSLGLSVLFCFKARTFNLNASPGHDREEFINFSVNLLYSFAVILLFFFASILWGSRGTNATCQYMVELSACVIALGSAFELMKITICSSPFGLAGALLSAFIGFLLILLSSCTELLGVRGIGAFTVGILLIGSAYFFTWALRIWAKPGKMFTEPWLPKWLQGPKPLISPEIEGCKTPRKFILRVAARTSGGLFASALILCSEIVGSYILFVCGFAMMLHLQKKVDNATINAYDTLFSSLMFIVSGSLIGSSFVVISGSVVLIYVVRTNVFHRFNYSNSVPFIILLIGTCFLLLGAQSRLLSMIFFPSGSTFLLRSYGDQISSIISTTAEYINNTIAQQ